MSCLSPLAAIVAAPELLPFAFATVTIIALRLHGWLSDEFIADLSRPFSKSTLTVVAFAVVLWQLSWITSNL